MAVTVKVVGDLRRFVDEDTVEIDGSPYTIREAVDEVVRRNPQLGPQLFDAEGMLHYAMVLSLDGVAVSWARDRDAHIRDGGELVLTRFHSGG